MTSARAAKKITLLLLISSALVLQACAPGTDVSPSLRPTPTEQIAAGQTIANAPVSSGVPAGNWWLAFGDTQLDRLVEEARKGAPSMQAAAARMERAQAALGVAGAARGPDAAGSGRLIGETFPYHYTYPAPYAGNTGNEGELGIAARWHLDFWGRYRSESQAADARVRTAEAEQADAALLLETSLVEAYIRLDAAYHMRDTAEVALARRHGVIDLFQRRADAGLASEIEVAQAKEAITATRSETARLDAEIAHRRNEIAALLGKGPGFGDDISRPMMMSASDPALQSVIPAALLGYRPDVIARREAVAAASKEIDVARAAFYPNIDLNGFAGLSALDVTTLFASKSVAAGIGPAVTLPIFDFGRLRSNLRGRNADYDAAVSAYNQTVAAALQQVADGLATLKAERSRQQQARQAEAHWARIADLQRTRETQGLSGALDRLSAEISLQLSRAATEEADARVRIAQIDLVRALGGAWSPQSTSSSNEESK